MNSHVTNNHKLSWQRKEKNLKEARHLFPLFERYNSELMWTIQSRYSRFGLDVKYLCNIPPKNQTLAEPWICKLQDAYKVYRFEVMEE